jgi:hypothetical protein
MSVIPYEDVIRKMFDTFDRNRVDLRTMDPEKRKAFYVIADRIDDACNNDDRKAFNIAIMECRDLLL